MRSVGWIADIGVPPKMVAAESKHVRFCNLSAIAGGFFALVFLGLSLPVITDWGKTTPREWMIIAACTVGALLLFLPVWLNQRARSGRRGWC